jgi:hypothetical protein
VTLYRPTSGSVIQSAFAECTANVSTTSVYVPGPPTSGYVNLSPLSITLTTEVNYLRVLFTCSSYNSTSPSLNYFRILLDGTMIKGSSVRITATTNSTMATALSSYNLVTAGSHTVTIQWCTSGGTARIRPATDVNFGHASLLVQEVQA